MPRTPWSALFLFSLAAAASARGERATPVIVAEVLQQSLEEELSLVGRLQPRRSSRVASQGEGLVVARRVEAGQRVEAGEILFELRNEPLRAALREARADFALRQANHARSLQLLRGDAAAEQQADDAEYDLERARAKLQGLEAQVAYLRIRAPFAGHVVQTLAELGTWVGRGEEVAQLISIDTVRAYVDVPERHVSRMAVGDAAQVFVDALGTEPVAGRIVAILAEGHAESRAFPVVVEVLNRQGRLRSNMSARVRFAIRQPGVATLVHKDALVDGPAGQMVFLAIDGRAVGRPVRTGLAHNGFVAVEGQLRAGDLAIVRGNERLRDGQLLRILRKHQ